MPEQVFYDTFGQLRVFVLHQQHLRIAAFLLVLVNRAQQLGCALEPMSRNFFSQREHARLEDRGVLAQQTTGIGLIHPREQGAQQVAVTGFVASDSDARHATAQITPVLLQGIALCIQHLQHFVTGPSGQALHQQQLQVAAGVGKRVVRLHFLHETLDFPVERKAFPGVDQHGRRGQVIHVYLAQHPFIGVAHGHNCVACLIVE